MGFRMGFYKLFRWWAAQDRLLSVKPWLAGTFWNRHNARGKMGSGPMTVWMTELERRAQIEETWARRTVFAAAMAEERLSEYMARRELGRMGDFACEIVSRVAPMETKVQTPDTGGTVNKPVREAISAWSGRPRLEPEIWRDRPMSGVAVLAAAGRSRERP